MIEWDAPNPGYYQHGLDRGVLYLPTRTEALPWNGLMSVEEGSEAPATSTIFRDGQIVLADVDPSDFSARVSALFYPDDLGPYLGMAEATDGFYVDNQKPKPFGMSYRTLVGSGTEGDMFGYQIHLIYNAILSISARQRKTINETIELTEFNFDMVATPKRLPGFRPSAHYIIDTRHMSPGVIKAIEGLLYGDDGGDGYLQDPIDIFELLNYDGSILVTHNVAAKTFTVEASQNNLTVHGDGTFTVTGLNAVDAPGDTYIISTGGDTTVIDA